MQVEKSKLEEVFRVFRKGFKTAEMHWTFRQMYLSNAEQSHNETVVAFSVRVEELVVQCN